MPGTTAHYLPYGDYRGAAPTATPLTERGYTGHHENRKIRSTDMSGRYSPTHPQSHNRYRRVLGNALFPVPPIWHI
ncbi:MAG: hypothetical protein KJ063_22135 [Anaerolineae bacterium]|nr:hypothetical protein [Anaerolineae bacterium]